MLSIRPSLWATCLAVVGGVIAVVALVMTAPGPSSEEAAWDEVRRGSRAPDMSFESARRAAEAVERRSWPAADPSWGGPDAPSGFATASEEDLAPDPQVQAMRRTLGLSMGDAGVPAPFYPTHHAARLTQVSGLSDVQTGESCEVRILPVRTGRFNCLMRVKCGDVVLYPDAEQHAGYVPCEVTEGVPVAAVDDGTTHQDGDPTIELDARSYRVRVSDDGARPFSAELHLERI